MLPALSPPFLSPFLLYFSLPGHNLCNLYTCLCKGLCAHWNFFYQIRLIFSSTTRNLQQNQVTNLMLLPIVSREWDHTGCWQNTGQNHSAHYNKNVDLRVRIWNPLLKWGGDGMFEIKLDFFIRLVAGHTINSNTNPIHESLASELTSKKEISKMTTCPLWNTRVVPSGGTQTQSCKIR